ncbi:MULTISPECIES: DUF5018 domain-containing protein [unclassified Proteiniphilum]|jgi:hypothetical protein|uniref:DUF5018 domain-containing protein n=1 Tax=unclassified Proteiniphilum TaxID=2622718 RepID=UPI0025795521|nr:MULTISPECIES: DUF5018 domain-containing protein [unclassified Proteiniphilum]
MKNLYKIAGILGLLLMFSCESADVLVPTPGNEVTGIRIMLPDGSNTDFAVTPDENNIIKLEVDGSLKTDLAKIRMSVSIPNNATVESSVPLGEYMDFSKPVSFDVIGADGAKQTYTVQLRVVPTAIDVKELWKKTAAELNFVSNNNGAIAFSGNYLVVHERTKFDYYNLQDGTKAGTLSFEGIDWNTLTRTVPLYMAGDDAGNIVASNFYMTRWMPAGGTNTIHMFWWEGVTAKPKLLFSYDVDIDKPGNIDVGRKIYVRGDISKHAFLYMGVSFQNMFLRWEIQNGQVVSEQPDKIEYDPGYQMGMQPTIVPVEFGKNANYFIPRYDNGIGKVAITYMDGTTNKPIYASEHHIQNVFHQWLTNENSGVGHSFDYVNMNGAKYIFLIEQDYYYWMREIFQVRPMMKDPSSVKSIVNLIHTRKWNDWLYFPLDSSYGKNGNVTGDVTIRVAPDGNSCTVAFLCTNSGVIVWNVNLE